MAQFISNQNGGYSKSGNHWNSVGSHLKAISGWNGTDDYGFSGLPGGWRLNALLGAPTGGIGFQDRGNDCFWWSSTGNSGGGLYRNLRSNTSSFIQGSFFTDVGFSVRCVKD